MWQTLSAFGFILKGYAIKYLAKVSISSVVICFIIIFIALILAKLSIKESAVISAYGTLIISVAFLGREFGTVHSSLDMLFTTYRAWLIEGRYWVIYEVFYNMVLFVPLGWLLYRKRNIFRHAILWIFIVTLLIEMVQLLTGTGLFEICDLIDNTLGGVIGIGLFKMWEYGKAKFLSKHTNK